MRTGKSRISFSSSIFCLVLLLSVLLSSMLLLSGCAGRLTGESYVSPLLPDKMAVERIAADAVEKLASLYPPGHTAIDLTRPQVKDRQGNIQPQTPVDAFSLALEDGLRQRGFAISPEATLRLAWTLDRLPRVKEEGADPLLNKAQGEAASRQSAETKSEEMDWWLRLKLADIDSFQVFSLTRMYDENGIPLAGFAEQVAGDTLNHKEL